MKIDKLVVQATQGNKAALEAVVVEIEDNIYHLALRILVNPDDAKEATQDILIKVITHLSSFKFESKFTTWVYRLAANYLLSEKKIIDKDLGLNFDIYKMDLESDLQAPGKLQETPEYQVMLNELRISCTMAMLLCLNLAHRMAYILGDIMEMEHSEASEVLGISKTNYRKQLSRARDKVVEFTSQSCSLVSNCAKCSCEKKLTGAVARNRVDAERIFFAGNNQYSYKEVKSALSETRQSLKTVTLQKSVKQYNCPLKLSEFIDTLVAEGVKSSAIRGRAL